MSGLCGFISSSDPGADREASLRRMCDAFSSQANQLPRVQTLGDCSLADRAPTGTHHVLQGGQTRDGRFHAVICGDLLNFSELRQELSTHGLQGAAVDAPSLIAHAYAAWSGGMLRRLRGAFALAVWDSENANLMLARDPLGQRTLYYAQHRDRFLFSSELRSLVSSGAFSVSILEEAVNDCVTYGAPVAPRTIYAGVHALRPGECLSLQAGRVTRRSYWTFRDVTPTNLPPKGTTEEFLPEFRSRLAEVIRAHFGLDARLGCMVTGDMGSTLVTGLAAKVSPTPLRTFSLCFADEGFRSEDYAPRIARHFGTRHESRLLGATDVARDLDAILASYEQPGDDILTPFYVSHAAASTGLTALLSGLGAGPLFGKSEWAQGSGSRSPFAAWQRYFLFGRQSSSRAGQILASLLRRGGSVHEVAALHQRLITEPLRQRLLGAPGLFRPHEELDHLPREVPDRDPTLVASAWALRTTLGGAVLPAHQHAASIHGMKFLFPLLDPALLSWCRSHPQDAAKTSLLEAGGLTSTLNDLLLPDLRLKPNAGDQPPFSLWMRGTLRPFIEQTFSDYSISQSGFFQASAIRQLWQTALSGQDADWAGLWRLAILINFVNRRTPSGALTPH